MSEDAITDQLLFDGTGERALPQTLVERFGAPPFSVLDARQGYWQARRRSWLSLGIEGEVGRPQHLTFGAGLGQSGGGHDRRSGGGNVTEFNPKTSTSVFDPVLAEVAYRWFCPQGGRIIDPFAGGSVRGIVAAALGYSYRGVDLRPEQVAANYGQAETILGPGGFEFPWPIPDPRWFEGDAMQLGALMADEGGADLIFTCPPYGDLEAYSSDPRDLSSMSPARFAAAMRYIAAEAVELLRPDRFAVLVMGETRAPAGGFYGIVSDTIGAFTAAGAQFWNEVIFVGSVGSAAVRAGKQFETSRKMPRIHQHVLVFLKGDERKATAACTRES